MTRREPIDDAPQQRTVVSSPATKAHFAHRPWLLALILVVVTVVAYQPVLRAGFIWDDNILITDNRMVQTADGLRRIWLTTEAPDYWPLTSSAWWLEWRLWGKNPVGFHMVNVILHALSAVLWWRILAKLKIPGAWLAALVFAIHPVNVATVAWISEQKNTLSMFFYAVAILFYLRFDEENRWRWYGLSLATFLLALFSKSAVVMLPVVLLGCGRWRHGRVRLKDLLHSLPFFVLSLVLGLVTVWFQYHRALKWIPVRTDSFLARLAAAGWVPWFYLYKALLPANLMVIYPKWEIDASRWVSYLPGMLLVGCVALFWWKRNTWGRPLLFGLGYFVVTLFPVLGFFDQSFYRLSLVADHWQYYSIVGAIALAVAAGEGICRRMGVRGRYFRTVACVAVVMVLGAATWRRSRVYASGETLWPDNVARNPGAWLAYNNLGFALSQVGKIQEAIAQYEQALRIEPDYAEAHYNLGFALSQIGKIQEAIVQYEQALRVRPDFAEAHYNLGTVFLQEGKISDAIGHYEQALRIKPDHAGAHNNLGNALRQVGNVEDAIGHYEHALRIEPDSVEAHYNLGIALEQVGRIEDAIGHYEHALRVRPDFAEAHYSLGTVFLHEGRISDAIGHYEQALRIKPDYAQAHNNLGNALEQAGRIPQAIVHLEQALRINPDLTEAQNNLAWVLATVPQAEGGDPVRAVGLAQRACERSGNRAPSDLDTLAAAYAATGRFDAAVAAAQKAIDLARSAGQAELLKEIEARLQLYRIGRAYHPPVSTATSPPNP